VEIPPFAVQPAGELEDCYFVTVPDLAHGAAIFYDRFTIEVTPGSHHTNVYRVGSMSDSGRAAGNVIHGGECPSLANGGDWPLVVNMQNAGPSNTQFDWRLPDGVAQRFEPGTRLMVQVHYFNTTAKVRMGHVKINFFRS